MNRTASGRMAKIKDEASKAAFVVNLKKSQSVRPPEEKREDDVDAELLKKLNRVKT